MVNRLIAEALRPYPADLVLTTKLGARLAGGGMAYAYRPGELREGNDRDRTVLGLDTVPLTHLRWGGAEDTYGEVTFDDAFDTMLAMRTEGRIDHIGLSNVTLDQLRRAHARAPIASVSNMFSYAGQGDLPAGTARRNAIAGATRVAARVLTHHGGDRGHQQRQAPGGEHRRTRHR